MTRAPILPPPARAEPGSDVRIEPVGESMGDALLALERACPIVADLTFRFDRDPDFFAWPRQMFERFRYAGAFHGSTLVGACLGGTRIGTGCGATGRYGYFGDARVAPAFRGRGLTEQMALTLEEEFFEEIEIALFLIKRGNRPADHLARTRRGVEVRPHPLCGVDVVNLSLLRRPGGRPRGAVREARSEDAEAIADLLAHTGRGRIFAPAPSPAELSRLWDEVPGLGVDRWLVAERAGRLTGVAGFQDLGPLKRTRVLRWSARGSLLRAAQRLACAFVPGAAGLPPAGGLIRALNVTHLGVRDADPAVLRDLLSVAVDRYRPEGYHLLHLGLAEGDPLQRALRGALAQHFRSDLWVFRRDDVRVPAGIPHIETCML